MAGSHDFSGVLRDFSQVEYTVGGASAVTVEASSAGGPSATRSFAPASVSAGGQVVVTITASDYGSAGRVTETLPAGFSYVSSSLSEGVLPTGQEVRFTLFGDDSFTYTVKASSVAGSHDFSGVLRDFSQVEYTVGGASAVTVEASSAGGPSATRSFAPASVPAGGQVVVTITASDYGSAGRVTETLPAGFSYVSSSLSEGVLPTGQEVRFTLFGDDSFTYTVKASSVAGSHDFSGVLRDFSQVEYTVGGASAVTVEASSAGGPSATRSFAPASVSPGGQVVVTITASDYGSAGRVTETLPAGFSYVSSSLNEGVVASGQTVRFTLFGDTSFTYTVTASSVVGSYNFNGVLRDFEREEYTVGGASSVRVGTVTPPSTGGGGGFGGGGGSQATPTPTPTPPAPTATPEPTVAPTAAPTVAPTAVPTVAPTAVPTVAPTAVPTVAPTAVPTVAATAVPTIAATAVPTVAPTAVPTVAPTVAPTAAPTAVPTAAPTAVPTVAPAAVPTAPPPATATSVSPGVMDEGGGIPRWLIVLLAIGALVVIGTLVIMRIRTQ